MKKISLAIFDLDGTILDSNSVWDDIDRRFLDSINQPWDEEFAKMVAQSDYHKAAVYTINRYHLETTPEALMKYWEDMAFEAYPQALDGVSKFMAGWGMSPFFLNGLFLPI